MNKFIIENKEFKTERGLLNHVSKMFPNAVPSMFCSDVILSVNHETVGRLQSRVVKLTGKTVTLVNSTPSMV